MIWGTEVGGWPALTYATLRRKMGALARHGYFFHRKVGITNDPERRWREAYAPRGWSEMRVIYVSRSHAHVEWVERELIDALRFGLATSRGWYYNRTGGGGGPKPKNGPYYVYLVGGPRYSRIVH